MESGLALLYLMWNIGIPTSFGLDLEVHTECKHGQLTTVMLLIYFMLLTILCNEIRLENPEMKRYF